LNPLLKRIGLLKCVWTTLGRRRRLCCLARAYIPKIVQEMLGHATITQAMDTYSHVLPDMQDKAVNAMEGFLS
jgi:integrase